MTSHNNKAASHLSGRRPCLEFEREQTIASEGTTQAACGDEGGDENTCRVRARCRRLLIAHLGEAGMRLFLQRRQPDLGERTGAELLEADPEDLFRRLKAIEAIPPSES